SAGVADTPAGGGGFDRGGLGVGAHNANGRDQETELARPSWLFNAASMKSVRSLEPSIPSKLIDSGIFIVTKVSRPPRRAPAVSNTAPDSSVSALRSAHDSSFCTGSYLLPTTPRTSIGVPPAFRTADQIRSVSERMKGIG